MSQCVALMFDLPTELRNNQLVTDMCLPPPFFLPVLLNAGDKGAQTFNLKNQTPG